MGPIAKRWALWAAFVLLVLPIEAAAGSLRAEIKGVKVELTSDPDRPMQGREAIYTILLRDAADQPKAGAKITLMGRMPDGMTVLVPLRETSQRGRYSGRVLFTMEGEWRLTVRIIQPGTPLELSLTEQVGR